MSISVNPQWYKNIWTLDMKAETWVEQTDYEIGFVTTVLQLEGSERILDLACGFGRHALALAQKGHSVVGVDITQAYVEEGRRLAKENQLDVEFICADIRDVSFEKAFDVVLNLGDGAIGYLENDEENLKVFDLISSVLKPGGKHLMSVPSAAYAKKHFPRRFWDMGSHSILLAEFDWDENNLRYINSAGYFHPIQFYWRNLIGMKITCG
ncbi:class I SAM-dependent methyltransferase, partial [bacterium]|nr:class I SAM-dependent methyltransferase [bacterium]